MSQEFCRLLYILYGFGGMGPVNTFRPGQNFDNVVVGVQSLIGHFWLS